MEDTSDLEKTLEYRPAAPASMRPFALDARGRRRAWAVSSGMVVVVLLATLAFVGAAVARLGVPGQGAESPRTASFAREPSRTIESPRPASAPSPGGATGEIPTVDVASLPRPPIGTVIGAPKHRLWIDGHLAPSWTRTVKCGVHVVRVGSQGEERTVNVPCGGEINVSP